MPPLDKFTTKAKDAIRRAHEIAIERGQNQVTPQHLMLALLIGEEESTISLMLEKQNIDYVLLVDHLFDSIESDLDEKPLTPTYQMFLTKELADVFMESQKLAKTLKDNFISSEHLFLAVINSKDKKTVKIKNDFLLNKKAFLETFKKVKSGNIKIVIKRRNKYLEKYTKDLTKEALENKLDPVIGRDKEISKMIEIISRRTKSNPILVGDPGVGKTAIVESFAQKLALKNVPDNLINKKLLSLDLGKLIAGTKFRGEFEERLKGLLKEIEELSGSIILFIDEMHTIMGAGGSEGALDASNLIKPALARKDFSLIGATTFAEHQKFVQKDGALTRRFTEIKVFEPSKNDTIKIINGLKKTYESYHGIEITPEAIVASVNLSDRYITDRKLPDKAIDLIDIASAKAKILSFDKPKKLKDIQDKIKKIQILLSANPSAKFSKKEISKYMIEISDLEEEERKINFYWKTKRDLTIELKSLNDAISVLQNELKILNSKNSLDGNFDKNSDSKNANQNIKKISDLKNISLPILKKKKKEIELKIKSIDKTAHVVKKVVDADLISQVVSKQTGIPIGKMMSSYFEKIKNIEDNLNSKIIGQKKAVEKIAQAIKVSQLDLSDAEKPAGSFIFLGKTGTGKTELAKEIASLMFDKKESFIRVDMQELMEGHSVSKLIGSPPGYVGFEEGGGLTEKVRNNPYSVVLFDEVEKANPEITNILLQVLDEGKLTDAKGRVVDFKNTIIIMTSNIGSEFFDDVGSIGFAVKDIKEDELELKNKEKEARKNILESLSDYFSPEFLNRIDETIIFNTLTKDNIKDIVKLQIKKQKDFLKSKLILKVTSSAINKLTDLSFSDKYGAREIKRVVKRKIINKLAEYIIENNNPQPEEYKISFAVDYNKKENKFIYSFEKKNIKKEKKILKQEIKDKHKLKSNFIEITKKTVKVVKK